MTSIDDSRKEVYTQKLSFTKPKQELRVGAWNLWTFYEAGKTAQAVKEMKRYWLTIIGIDERRWTNSDIRSLISGETVYYSERIEWTTSGRNDSLNYGGQTKLDKIGSNQSSRIITGRIFLKYTKTTIVHSYTPIEHTTEDEKDQFYKNKARTLHTTTPQCRCQYLWRLFNELWEK